MIKKVFIKTWGCQMNVRDSEVICGLLKNEGYKITDESEKADIILFNTCSVRQHAEDKVWSEIGRYKKFIVNSSKFIDKKLRTTNYELRTKPIIGLIGCMAQFHKEKVFERAPQVDFVVGPQDLDKIPQIIKKLSAMRYSFGRLRTRPRRIYPERSQKTLSSPSSRFIRSGSSPATSMDKVEVSLSARDLFESKIWETDGEYRPEEIYHTGFYEDKEHAYVVISEGCSNFCSYCVVPYVRGQLRNRDYEDILREIEQAVDKGITQVILLGQNVNAYQYNGVNFIKLIKFVNSIKGLKEFSFITSHPKDTSIDLFRAMQDSEKLKKYLHLPVQSGSDRILKLMNREYSRQLYLDLVDNYRRIVKNGSLTTDIIVGFSTETKEDFADTYDLVKNVEFDAAYIFKYSLRPNTEAEKLVDDVLGKEKERRHRIILDLQKKISNKLKMQSEKCKVKV